MTDGRTRVDGGAFNAHAFLWTKRDGIRDLGTLPGDALSQALGINNWRQVVGISCTTGFASCRGFLWQNGAMTDLNSIVAPGYSDHIYAAGDINDLGRIPARRSIRLRTNTRLSWRSRSMGTAAVRAARHRLANEPMDGAARPSPCPSI